MNKREKVLIILCVLAIICVAGIVVYRKSSNSDTQEKSSISDAVSDVQEKSSNSDVPGKNSDSGAQENYEDSSGIVQLILVGEIDIDMYSQDELKYYYHPNSEDYKKDGPHIRFHDAGKLGDQDMVITYFDKERYTIKLTSTKNQISQIGIMNEQKLQALSDFSLKEGDVIEILYSPEKTELRYNNKKINFDEERSLPPEDVK